MTEISILDAIGVPAMYEMLAEEATELAHAAQKMARIQRGENPTPVTEEEARENLTEEFTDVIQCALELGLEADEEQISEKKVRFESRWIEANQKGQDNGKRTL